MKKKIIDNKVTGKIIDNKVTGLIIDNKVTGKIFDNNLFKSVTSIIATNFTTILVSIFWVFVLPGRLGTVEFGLFNLFMLYIVNIALLQLGFKEGFILKFGKMEFEEIPIGRIKLYTRIYLFIQIGFTVLFGLLVIPANLGNPDLLFLYIMVTINIVAVNLNSYYGTLAHIFREHGLKGYIESLHKLANTLAIIPVVIFGLKFRFLAIYFTVTNIAEYLYYVHKYSKFESNNRHHKIGFDLPEFITIFKKGLPIMISNFVALIIFSIDRLMINMNFELEDFAIYLFAGSVIAIAISLMNNAYSYANVYVQRTVNVNRRMIFDILTVASILFGVITLGTFFLTRYAINTFLPTYSDAVLYISILLPALMFRSEISVVKKSFIMASESQKQNFIITLAILVLAIALNILFINVISFHPAAVAYATFTTFFVWYIAYDIYFTRIGFPILKRKYPYILIIIVVYVEISSMNANWILSLLLFFAIAIVVSVIFYYRIANGIISRLLKEAREFTLSSSINKEEYDKLVKYADEQLAMVKQKHKQSIK